MSGHLKPTSHRALAERYLRTLGEWVTSAELAVHIGARRRDMASVMSVCLAYGVVQRRRDKNGVVSWLYVGVEEKPRFTIDWPPQFVSKFFEARV